MSNSASKTAKLAFGCLTLGAFKETVDLTDAWLALREFSKLEDEFEKMKQSRDEWARIAGSASADIELVKTELATVQEQLQQALYGK